MSFGTFNGGLYGNARCLDRKSAQLPQTVRTRNFSQMHYARQSVITEEMQYVAKREKLEPELVRDEVARGRAIIPANIHHGSLEPMGIGVAFFSARSTQTLSEIPATTSDISGELEKLHRAVHYGSDTVMDLSTGGDIPTIRKAIINASPVPIGTVPIYEAISRVRRSEDLNINVMLEVIEEQAEQGVDYMTIHAGVLREFLPLTRNRITGIVSRGGAILAQWMSHNKQQNFLYENFDAICKIFQKHDVSFSLGDGLRPGCLADASDEAQFAELKVLGELTKKAWEYDVQVMIEGLWHIPWARTRLRSCRGEKGKRAVPRSAVLHARAARHGHCAWLRPHHQCHRRGDDWLARRLDALLRDAEGTSRFAERGRRSPGRDRLQNRRTRGGCGAPSPRRARSGRRSSAMLVSFSTGTSNFELSLDPETARAMHDETLPDDFYKDAKFCSMCGPKFCSMNATQIADIYQGFDQKDREAKFAQLLAKVEP